MTGRHVALYFAWSRPDEVAAPLGVLEDRFPALFELRRLFWPRFEQFADPAAFDQGIGGFLDNIQLANFKLFADSAAAWTGNPVRRAERRTDAGLCALDGEFLAGVDTLVIISFDSFRTAQQASAAEIAAVRSFLADPDHTLFVCPHHDIGNVAALPEGERRTRQEIEFHHHGDPAIPARQRFGDFGLSLLAGWACRRAQPLRPPPREAAGRFAGAARHRRRVRPRRTAGGRHELQPPCASAAFRAAGRGPGEAGGPGAPAGRSRRPRRIPSPRADGGISTPCCKAEPTCFPAAC